MSAEAQAVRQACARRPPAQCSALGVARKRLLTACWNVRAVTRVADARWSLLQACGRQATAALMACDRGDHATARTALYKACTVAYEALGIDERPFSAQQAEFDGVDRRPGRRRR